MPVKITNHPWTSKLKYLLFLLIIIGMIFSFFVSFDAFNSANTRLNIDQVSFWVYFVIPQLISWVLAGIAIIFLRIELKTASNKSFSLIIGILALLLTISYVTNENLVARLIQQISILFLGELVFFTEFPAKIDENIKKDTFGITILISTLLFLVSVLNHIYLVVENLPVQQVISIYSVLLLGVGILFSIINLLKTPIDIFDRDQFSSLGVILGITPLIFWIFQGPNQSDTFVNPWASLVFIIYPIAILTIQRTQFLRFNNSQKAIMISMKNLILFLGIIGLIVFIITIFGELLSPDFPKPQLYLGLSIFCPSLISYLFLKRSDNNRNAGLDPLKKTQIDTDPQFESPPPKQNTTSLYKELKQTIFKEIKFGEYFHFEYDEHTNSYSAFHFDGSNISDLVFPINSGLVKYLQKNPQTQIFENYSNLPDELIDDSEKLKLLGCNLYLPINDGDTLLGWVALNDPTASLTQSLKKYDNVSKLIQNTINKISVVFQQRLLVQRTKNLDLLTRIVQGVNYTLSVDDIFELIYTQVNLIIPFDDFYIILKDSQSNDLRYEFYVENDERFSDKEIIIFGEENSIEKDVINSGLGFLANRYSEVCIEKGYRILHHGVQSAIVIPLNTGANSIGCVFLGKNDPTTFTENQFNLIQSIADLVAGAIEKARLLEETDVYARQLAILNDLTRKLTSTLEIDELYDSILQNSLDLVKCEEARLAILDENSQDLIYRSVYGTKSQPLLLKKIAKGIGISWQSFNTQEVIVKNNLSDINQEMVVEPDYKFPVNSLLVVPLIVKNQVLGILELINRNRHLNFTPNDQELITALAAQAAIALENIRLYRRTDQELSKRVDELSVMQRVDRELNANLDKRKVMEITLFWALHQMNCEAGWIGNFEADKLDLLVSQGYDQTKLAEKITSLNINKMIDFGDLLINGNPIQSRINNEVKLHPEGKSRLTVPIQRDGTTLAIMMLENFEGKIFDQNEINFLLRLCDHASIAIVNSQLYFEVQAANQAKTEFVSLVAHELKNPMTSIKGYSELLASGAVGSITADQSKFLNTIRNNIDRMNILISDLNDLSKIETGNLRLERKSINLIKIIDETIRSIKRQIDEKNQTLRVIIDNNFPPINADPDRLQQILTNLLSNANKYTNENGEITVEVTKRQESEPNSNYMAQIKVSDNGVGISDQDKESIFEKFFRSEDPNIRASSGTGLGLNITRSLVEMQGGQIWFESDYQKGTSFYFTLPIAD